VRTTRIDAQLEGDFGGEEHALRDWRDLLVLVRGG
jgi:hypothetical protein